jgi:hypothetical protein
MKEISRSVRQAKHAKFLDVDYTCPYSPYGDVAGSYRPYGDDMAVDYWLVVGVLDGDTCPVEGE